MMGDTINTFNLETKEVNHIIPNTAQTYYGYRSACLTGDETQSLLYYIGGKNDTNWFDNMQILNISDSSWRAGPSMNTKRGRFLLHCITK